MRSAPSCDSGRRRVLRALGDAGRWTRPLVDAALDCGGRHYLPYRLHATRERFLRAYPESHEFAAIKRKLDPSGRFRNRLWDRYLPGLAA